MSTPVRRFVAVALSAVLAAAIMTVPAHAAFTVASVPYNDEPPARAGLQYDLDPGRWPGPTITYRFVNYTADLPVVAQRMAIQSALRTWEGATPLRFVENTQSATIEFAFHVGAHGDQLPFGGGDPALAHGFYPPPTFPQPIAGDVHFDDGRPWTDQIRLDAAPPYDLETVALHEIGHALGVRHSTDPSAVMAGRYTGTRRTLTSDDVLGIRAKYAPAHRWATGYCPPSSTCLFGDVDGSGRASAVSFSRDAAGGPEIGDVWVARSGGGGFLAPEFWADHLCVGAEQCALADITGDFRADVVTVVPATGDRRRLGRRLDRYVVRAAGVLGLPDLRPRRTRRHVPVRRRQRRLQSRRDPADAAQPHRAERHQGRPLRRYPVPHVDPLARLHVRRRAAVLLRGRDR